MIEIIRQKIDANPYICGTRVPDSPGLLWGVQVKFSVAELQSIEREQILDDRIGAVITKLKIDCSDVSAHKMTLPKLYYDDNVRDAH